MADNHDLLLWATLAASIVGALASLATFLYIFFNSRPQIEASRTRLLHDDEVSAKLVTETISSSRPSSPFLSSPLLAIETQPEPELAPTNELIEIPESPPKLSSLHAENTPRAANISFKSLAPPSTSKKRGRGLQRGSDSILDRFT